MESHDVYVWGSNKFGCLGLGHFENQKLPVPVESVQTTDLVISKVACGGKHMVLVTQENEFYTAGSNDSGQLGLPTDVSIPFVRSSLVGDG